jgi:hypothetical protein
VSSSCEAESCGRPLLLFSGRTDFVLRDVVDQLFRLCS